MVWKYKHRQKFVWQAIWQEEACFACLNRATRRGLSVGWGCRWLVDQISWIPVLSTKRGYTNPYKIYQRASCDYAEWGIAGEAWCMSFGGGGEHFLFSLLPSSLKQGRGVSRPPCPSRRRWRMKIEKEHSAGRLPALAIMGWGYLLCGSVCVCVLLAYGILCILIDLWKALHYSSAWFRIEWRKLEKAI